MTNEHAYRIGCAVGSRFGFSAKRFDAAARYGDAEYPAWYGRNAVSLFWDAGLRGLEMPRRVRAIRIGKVPSCGFSTNFRDQHAEAGVSVLQVIGEDRKDNGTFDMFNGGEKITVEGWLHFRTGSDGEPLLVEAVEIK